MSLAREDNNKNRENRFKTDDLTSPQSGHFSSFSLPEPLAPSALCVSPEVCFVSPTEAPPGGRLSSPQI